MKKSSTVLTIAAVILGVLVPGAFAGEVNKGETTVTGVVTDSMCKGEGASAEHKDCALKCAREKGAKLGVWDSGGSRFYVLDDQKKAEEYAGEKVTVKGTVNEATGTLKASSIVKVEKKKG